jgi:hypothetical protein
LGFGDELENLTDNERALNLELVNAFFFETDLDQFGHDIFWSCVWAKRGGFGQPGHRHLH